MTDSRIFLGLDIGTDSVGWAVTDDRYNLQKFKGNLMWGVSLFDAANQSSNRRIHRTERRRLDRRKQRISLLQDFFAPEILKIDERFFLRLKESALFPEDSDSRTGNIFFDDENYGDKEYFSEYKTIHHLICELMCNSKPHDVRLVYLACAYLLAHRGHFLSEIDKNNITEISDFSAVFQSFNSWFESYGVDKPFNCSAEAFSGVLKSKRSPSQKEKELKMLLYGGKKPQEKEDYPVSITELLKMVCGGTSYLSKLFNKDEYAELENNKVTASAKDFDEKLETLTGQIDCDHAELLGFIKRVYDWSLLVDIMQGFDCISKAKVAVYEHHKRDLKNLKYICKKYLPDKYSSIFRATDGEKNYVNYSGNLSSVKARSIKKCSQEDFCKYIGKIIKSIDNVDVEDKTILDELISRCNSVSLCPKQVNTDNRVIPYQLYYAELKRILENSSGYLPFLNEKDEYGTVAEKILSIMEFRIPYYVGPLVKMDNSKNAWIERKAEGKIYPWNFDDMVDHDKSENAFIRRMTCKCTYLAGEDVLPKNSLLNSKFNVLNEINKIAVNGKPITVEQKQAIFEELFVRQSRRVTKKRIGEYLISRGEMNKEDEITGIDDTVKSSLRSFHDFRGLIEDKQLTQDEVEDIIAHITVTTDRVRLKKWLRENYSQISDKDINYISGLRYSDYGRISRELLEEICEVDASTGEIISEKNIITRLWETNDNLMQLLSGKYGYSACISKCNADYYREHELTLEQRLKDMYIPTAVKRSVYRTLDIAKELKGILKKSPDKIFIEMARGDIQNQKGKRTDSRRKQISEAFKVAREFAGDDTISELETQLGTLSDSELRSEKYFLYFMQLGRCMYSWAAIDFSELGNDSKYNVDHIYPRAKVKDDSIDNKVLVSSSINGKKGDTYPIDGNIRRNMHGFWSSLQNKKLISEEKFKRLTRAEAFTDEELAGFINRQLVETRQSTKAVAALITDIFPDSEIVYVKAHIISDFRQQAKLLKCREINDLHHAKDAYLNIVLGNVYNVKFTKNPINLIKNNESYSMNLFKSDASGNIKGLLAQRIERGGELAWNPKSSFDVLRRTMAKNSIRYVRYTYRRKSGQNGGFFDQNPVGPGKGKVPIKKNLPVNKYGGYDNPTISFFSIVSLKGYGNVIIAVELMFADRFEKDYDFAREYATKAVSEIMNTKVDATDIGFILDSRIVKINTVLEFDDVYRVNMAAKTGNCIKYVSAMPLILSAEAEQYCKRIASVIEKGKSIKDFKLTKFDRIDAEKNLKLFDTLCAKCCTAPFSLMFVDLGQAMLEKREAFILLEPFKQITVLFEMVRLLKTGRKNGVDLRSVGGKEHSGIKTLNMQMYKIKDFKSIRIIDQSPTGLFEKKSRNLLKL